MSHRTPIGCVDPWSTSLRRASPDWSVLHEEIEVHDHDILDAGEYAIACAMRDGRIVRLDLQQPKQALKAVGVEG